MNEKPVQPDEAVIVAEVVPSATSTAHGHPSLPEPGLPLSFALAFTPQVIQIFVGIAVGVVAAIIFTAVTQQPKKLQSFLEEHEVFLLPLGTLTTLVTAIAVAKLMYWRQTSRCIGLRGFSVWQGIGMAMFLVPLAILASELTNVLGSMMSQIEPEWLTDLRRSFSETFQGFAEQSFLLVLVAGCLLPGIGEEILCRGVMGRGLVARHGMLMGVFWTSLLFGIMHIEPIQAFGAFALGLGLHFIFLATQSLVAAMTAHAVNNALAFVLMRNRDTFPLPGLSTLPEEGAHTPLIVVLAAVLAFAASGLFLYQIRTHWRLENGGSWSPGYLSAESPPDSIPAEPEHAPVNIPIFLAAVVTFALLIGSLFLAYV